MGRPKSTTSSADISAEIARLQEESQMRLRQLEERRRAAQARENQRRGELVAAYLSRPDGRDLRRMLLNLADPADQSLFVIGDHAAVEGGAN